MVLSHISKSYGAKAARVSRILTDPEGGTPTFGPRIVVPGIKSLTVKGDIESKTLRGDNRLLDQMSTLSNVSADLEYAKISLDLLGAFFRNSTVTDAGVTPSQVATWSLGALSEIAKFRLEVIAAAGDQVAGDVLITLFSCSLTSFPELGMAEEDYKTSPLSVGTSPLLSTGQWVDVSIRETGGSIGAPVTGVTAGTPGQFSPTDAAIPASLAALKAHPVVGDAGTSKPSAAFTTGQYVVLGDSSTANWSALAGPWVAGIKA